MTKEQRQGLPESIVVREIQYRVSQKALGLQLSLSSRRYLTTMKMEILRSKSPDNIRKQIFAFCLIYNLVRLIMLKAAIQQKVPPDCISLSDALRWLAAAQ